MDEESFIEAFEDVKKVKSSYIQRRHLSSSSSFLHETTLVLYRWTVDFYFWLWIWEVFSLYPNGTLTSMVCFFGELMILNISWILLKHLSLFGTSKIYRYPGTESLLMLRVLAQFRIEIFWNWNRIRIRIHGFFLIMIWIRILGIKDQIVRVQNWFKKKIPITKGYLDLHEGPSSSRRCFWTSREKIQLFETLIFFIFPLFCDDFGLSGSVSTDLMISGSNPNQNLKHLTVGK